VTDECDLDDLEGFMVCSRDAAAVRIACQYGACDEASMLAVAVFGFVFDREAGIPVTPQLYRLLVQYGACDESRHVGCLLCFSLPRCNKRAECREH